MIPRLAERPNAPPFPVAGNWFERPSGLRPRLSMPGASIGSIRQEMSFGSKSGGQRETDIVQEGKTETGALLSRWMLYQHHARIHFTGWGESSANERRLMAIGGGGAGAARAA